MAIPFVGQRFTPSQFDDYLAQVQFSSSFRPEFAVLHHTSSPSLDQRPNGFTDQHLQNLLDYYQNQLGWSGAPHLFIDDRPDGIIVFQRMDRRGVHAVSFNRLAWGVEMLGDYDCEPFHTGRGAAVRDMAMRALAAMCRRLDVGADTIRFHRDDPKTSKTCPGTLVKKTEVVARVCALLSTSVPADTDPGPGYPVWHLKMPDGSEHLPVHVKDGRPIARIRALLDALSPGGQFALSGDQLSVRWTKTADRAVSVPVAELDESGTSWALVRTLAEAAGRTISVSGDTVQIG